MAQVITAMILGFAVARTDGQHNPGAATGPQNTASTGFIPVVVSPGGGQGDQGFFGQSQGTEGFPSIFNSQSEPSGQQEEGQYSQPSGQPPNGPYAQNGGNYNNQPGSGGPYNSQPGGHNNGPSSPQQPNPPQNGQQPARQSNLDALTGYAVEFLTSLNRDQLTSFLRVYFMSKMMGTSILDPRGRASLTRSATNPSDRRAIAAVSRIPASPRQVASLGSSRVGAILDAYAKRMRKAGPAERSFLVRDYQKTIENLRIPKGVKYALKHIM